MIRLARNGGQGERGQERDCGKSVATPLITGNNIPWITKLLKHFIQLPKAA